MSGVLTTAWQDAAASARVVFDNPNLRRVNLAFAGSLSGDTACTAAVGVYAFSSGGAGLAAGYFAVRFASAAVALPFLSALAERFEKKAFLVSVDLIRACAMVAIAVMIWLSVPVLVVLTAAVVAGLVGCPFGAVQGSLLPRLVDRPQDLNAANAVATVIESAAWLVGPALAGLVLTVADVSTVWVFNAITFLWSALLLSRLRVPASSAKAQDEPASDESEQAAGERGSARGFLHRAGSGFAAVAADRSLLLLFGLVVGQTAVYGMSSVLVVVVGFEILGAGESGTGYLMALLGLGSVLGGLVALMRAARGHLGYDFAAGLLFWAVPWLLLAIFPSPVPALVTFLLLGIADPLIDANIATIIQRTATPDKLQRVLAVYDSLVIAAIAAGAAVLPFLLSWWGLRGTLLSIAVVLGGATVAALPALGALDRRLRPPPALDRLRTHPVFEHLDPSQQEALAARCRQIILRPDDVAVREGELGDCWYLVAAGRVRVHRGPVLVTELGPGGSFGEPALLAPSVRGATVTVVRPVRLWQLHRQDFLDVVADDGALDGHLAALIAARAVP